MNDGFDIRIDADGIVAAWLYNDGEVWVEYAPDRPVEAGLFAALDQAVVAANDEVCPEHQFGTGAAGTVAGGALKLKYPPSEEALRDWLGVFARQVRAEGWAPGTVHTAPGIPLPAWLRSLTAPMLTVYASYDVTAPDGLSPDLCERAAQWGSRSGGPEAFLLSSALTLPDRADELGRHLHLALASRPSTAAIYASEHPGRLSRVSLSSGGHASFQLHDAQGLPGAFAASADHVRAALLIGGEHTRWSGAALANRRSNAWDTLATSIGEVPIAPTIPPWANVRNNPLWSTYVPDAFGMQLLTEEHLSRVTDLSAWTVTEQNPGRYLVEATDLAGWFRPDGPSADVLAAARADFGQAIVPPGLS